MFSDEELKNYQNEFEKINKNVNLEEIKSILYFLYSYSLIIYEAFNNNKLKECLYEY